MRKWELIKQSKLLKIKGKILSNLFNEKYGLKLGEFNNTTGTERVKYKVDSWEFWIVRSSDSHSFFKNDYTKWGSLPNSLR